MSTDKFKFPLWLKQSTKDMVDSHYKDANCSSRSEYIEKAIQFYTGFLDCTTEAAGRFLPTAVATVLEGKTKTLGDRIGRMLFKLTVDEAIMSNIIAYDTDIDIDTLERLRTRCIKDVKETNGGISFEDALRLQKGL